MVKNNFSYTKKDPQRSGLSEIHQLLYNEAGFIISAVSDHQIHRNLSGLFSLAISRIMLGTYLKMLFHKSE